MKPEDLPPAMDFDLLLERLGGDAALARELADLYIVEYPKQLADLQSALAAHDLKRVQQAAHKIKGTARNFAAAPAEECARELEETKEFGDGAAIAEITNRLSNELQRLQAALEQALARQTGGIS